MSETQKEEKHELPPGEKDEIFAGFNEDEADGQACKESLSKEHLSENFAEKGVGGECKDEFNPPLSLGLDSKIDENNRIGPIKDEENAATIQSSDEPSKVSSERRVEKRTHENIEKQHEQFEINEKKDTGLTSEGQENLLNLMDFRKGMELSKVGSLGPKKTSSRDAESINHSRKRSSTERIMFFGSSKKERQIQVPPSTSSTKNNNNSLFRMGTTLFSSGSSSSKGENNTPGAKSLGNSSHDGRRRSAFNPNMSSIVNMWRSTSKSIGEKLIPPEPGSSRRAPPPSHLEKRLEQERREKIRDHETEDSPYLVDAQRLTEYPIDMNSETATQSDLKRISMIAWLGGIKVQDLLSQNGTLGSIGSIIRNRLQNIKEGDPEVEQSGHSFMDYVKSFRDHPETKISEKTNCFAMKAIASACRGHVKNQEFALHSGLLALLLEVVTNKAVNKTEKKWGLHTINVIILPDGEAQTSVLKSEKASQLRAFCAQNFTNSHWERWPHNEAAITMKLFDWRP